jgi:hypothetical protein
VPSPNASGARPITPDIGATRRHCALGAGLGESPTVGAPDARFRNNRRHTALTRLPALAC